MKFLKILTLSLVFLGLAACTDLEETFHDSLTEEQARELIDPSAILQATYNGFRTPYMDQSRYWAAQQHTSDETMGPTRGPDWDDNGVWRVLHNHTWTPQHGFLESTFNELLQIVFNATDVLNFSPSQQEAAEALFLRAFAMFSVADAWGQVPFRQPGEVLLNPSQVLSATQALDQIISDVTDILNDLPDGPAYKANKDAARVLLMKAYLNYGTFGDRANPKFDAADMDKVITLADEIIASGKYSIQDNFYENFAPNNDQISSELIFTGENIGGVSSGNVRFQWFCGLHYNQNPSGWNGFCTIADFYDKFDANDERLGMDYPGITDVGGIRVGFLEGQQHDQTGAELDDRKGNKLVFTKEVDLIETGNDLEIRGIRVVKYPIDYNSGDNADNDWVFYRYSDVLLMKAEALLRTNQEPDARDIVNDLRAMRGLGPLGTLTLDNLLDERGFELYWEGHRRTDLIRFGKFLNAWDDKPATGNERLLFPIPSSALAVNPNLKQNPGY
jgi:hypothetical protein